jgi:hypothetical protein
MMVFMIVTFLDASFLENLFCIPGVAIGGGSSFCFADQYGRFFSISPLFFFWLCAYLMSRLALDIMLLQRLGVIDIFMVLIYSLYQKKKASMQAAGKHESNWWTRYAISPSPDG